MKRTPERNRRKTRGKHDNLAKQAVYTKAPNPGEQITEKEEGEEGVPFSTGG